MTGHCKKCSAGWLPSSLLTRGAHALPVSAGLSACATPLAAFLAVFLLLSPGDTHAAQTAARADTAATPAFAVAYLEMPVSAVVDTRTLLQRHAADARAAAVRASAATFQVYVLHEVGRAERWLVLQWADSPSQLQTIEAAVAEDLASPHGMLVAPLDERSNHPLPATAAATAVAAPSPGDRQQIPPTALYAVTHLDIGVEDQSAVIEAVHDLVEDARRAPGNLLAEAWQQNSRANHYALLFVWRSRADRDAFNGGAAERRYRGVVGPLLGSPYDERLYRRVN
jgi:quinol monooxygenase YgiN